MTTYYFDTNALSKRYVQETGSAWGRAMLNPSAGHLLLTARITMVEIYSALARRIREGTISTAACKVVTQAFTNHSVTDYEFVNWTWTS